MSDWRRGLVVAVGLAAALLAQRVYSEGPVLRGTRNIDRVHYFTPTATFLHDELRAGRLATWNPYQLAGQPLAALHIPGAFYPPHVVVLGLFEAEPGMKLLFGFHLAVAAFFTWLLTARLGLGGPARFGAAATYALCGPMLFGFFLPAMITTEAWLPAILWAIHGLLEEATPKWSVALAGVLALAFLGGGAQAFVFQVLLAAVFGLFCIATPGGREPRRAIGLALWGGLIALGFVGPQLLPAIEVVAQGARSFDGLTLAEAAYWSVSPEAMLSGLVGQLAPGADVAPMSQQQPGHTQWLMGLPVLGLPLAAIGWLDRARRRQWFFWLTVAVLTGLFALGSATPIFRLYHATPLGDLFRGPMRIAFIYLFAVSMLVGFGIHGIASRLRARGHTSLGARAVVLALAGLVAADFFTRASEPFADLEPRDGAHEELISFLRAQAHGQRVFVQDPSPFPNARLRPKLGMMNRVFAVPDYEPMLPASYQAYLAPILHQPWHGTLNLLFQGSHHPPDTLARLLDLMSVRYYAILADAAPQALRKLSKFARGNERELGGVRLYERPEALPRAYAVRRVRFAPDVDSFVARVESKRFRPREEVVLIGTDIDRGAFDALDGNTPSTRDHVSIGSYAPTEVVLDVQCTAHCVVVLTDLAYPGWRAAVDGVDQTIHAVNMLYRGVLVEPGAHEIVYRFEPLTLRFGVGMLAAALIASAFTLALTMRRDGRTPSRSVR